MIEFVVSFVNEKGERFYETFRCFHTAYTFFDLLPCESLPFIIKRWKS